MKHLLQASDLLAIGAVETECFNFLKTGLTVSNCVKRFLLADAKKSWHKLARHVQRFIQLRFDQLMKQTQASLLHLQDAGGNYCFSFHSRNWPITGKRKRKERRGNY